MSTKARFGRPGRGSHAPARPVLAVVLFCVVFLAIYQTYLAKIWFYQGINWQDPSTSRVALVVAALVLTGVAMPRRINRPSAFCLWLLYVIVIVPSALLALASDWLPQSQRLPAALGLCALLLGMRLLTGVQPGVFLPRIRRIRVNFWVVGAIISAITYGWFFVAIGVNHAYISFTDIYAVRADFKTALAGVPLLAYLLPLTYACINPALIVWGTINREPVKVALGIVGNLVIYLASGARLALLAVPLLLWIAYQDRWGRPVRPAHLLAVFSTLILFARVMDWLTGSLMWTAVFNMRILALPGVITVGYFKYFQEFPQLGMSSFLPWHHVEGRDPLVLVGEWIFHTPGTNANVNFIGSGFMHAGVAGILVETAVAVLLLRLADDAAADLPVALRYSFFVVPAVSLANGSAFTSILTYGFGASLVLAFIARHDPRLLAGPRSTRIPLDDALTPKEPAMNIFDYVRIVRRRWPIIVVSGALLAALALAYTTLQGSTTSYQSTSSVLVSAQAQVPNLNPGPSAADLAKNYAEVVKSRDNAAKALESLDLSLTPDQLRSQISSDVPLGTSIIRITVTGQDAETAQQTNEAVIGALASFAQAPRPTPSGFTPAAVTITTVDSPSAGQSVTSGGKAVRNTLVGLVLGLLAGLGLAVARELLDRSIEDPADVEALARLPILGRLPADAASDSRPLSTHDRSTRAEAVRTLRTTLCALRPPRDEGHLLLFAGVRSAEASATVALATALSMSQAGLDVLFVESRLDDPAVAEKLGLDSGKGLTTALAGGDPMTQIQRHADSGLKVMAAGPTANGPAEALASAAAQSLLRQLASAFDYVIVDAAAFLTVADPLILATQAETVVVIEHGRTTTDDAQQVMEGLAVIDAPVLGLVVAGGKARGASSTIRRHSALT